VPGAMPDAQKPSASSPAREASGIGSETPNRSPASLRLALIVLTVAVVMLVGHFGARAIRRALPFRSPGAPLVGRLPLPEGAARVGAVAGGPARTVLRYRVPAGPEQAEAFFRERLPAEGWRNVATEKADAPVRTYSNERGDWCTILVTPAEDGGAYVNIICVPGRPAGKR